MQIKKNLSVIIWFIHGHVRIKVDVGHERSVISPAPESGVDVLQVFGLAHALCGESHILSSGFNYAYGLLHASLGVVGRRGCHRLYPHRIVSSQRSCAHIDNRTIPSGVIKDVHDLYFFRS